jgi:hypothetical protein
MIQMNTHPSHFGTIFNSRTESIERSKASSAVPTRIGGLRCAQYTNLPKPSALMRIDQPQRRACIFPASLLEQGPKGYNFGRGDNEGHHD